MKLVVIVLLVVLVLFLRLVSYRANKYDSDFFKFITGKDLVICGNSPQYTEQIKKVNISSNTIIVRFNNAIYHIPENSKTDILILNVSHYYLFLLSNYNKYKKQQNIKYVFCATQFNEYGETFYIKNGIKTPTSGMIFLYFITKHIDLVNSVTLVGFNLLISGHPWDKIKVSKEHDVENETRLLNKIINQNLKIKKL
jgi:hypothetical protein